MENPKKLPSDGNPDELLRIENEALQLKLRAETGAAPQFMGNVPPETESEFLKYILAFEKAAAEKKQIKVFDRLEQPLFCPCESLSDDEIGEALDKILKLLNDNFISLDFLGEYDARVKYRFITEELFEHQMNDISIEGMFTQFTYEEFHPNHKLDIADRTEEFISGWFKQNINEQTWELGDNIIFPDTTIWSKSKAAEKLKTFFDCYTNFADCDYSISDINFELQHDSDSGLGYAEGFASYTAVPDPGEPIHFSGPFKMYLSYDYGWWSIFYFNFPGFDLKQSEV